MMKCFNTRFHVSLLLLFKGYKFMREAYLKLGQNEPIDQTDFANHLIGEYPAIDSNNVALWGWVSGTETYFENLKKDFSVN